jgi:hypothetical protein
LVLALSCCSAEVGDGRVASSVEPPRTADLSYAPELPDPAYAEGQGPNVCVDETHNNFHTSVGTYLPFARALRSDGYGVRRFPADDGDSLEACDVLVIADAQPPERAGDPPTFSLLEVEALNRWVTNGGSLFLITDHLPDPGAIEALAASFGVEVHDGYVLNGPPERPGGPIIFRLEDGTLRDDPLLRGRGPREQVTQVATFRGSAVRGSGAFRPLLVFGPDYLSWAPEEYYRFDDDTPRVIVAGWSQGGVLEHGAGRLAVFGEAAMFTAQVFDEGETLVGMNAPEAPDNLQLLLNVMHWLSRLGEAPRS